MKLVAAMDSFKGSLSAEEASEAVRLGARQAGWEAAAIPVADGGEGTAKILTRALGGKEKRLAVTGPEGEKVPASYGVLPDKTAVMEMAASSGLTLVKGPLSPRSATTFGVGEMILDAVKSGCRRLLLGIGGSATTEAGIGMLGALGFRFFDSSFAPLPPVFESLSRVFSIRKDGVLPAVLSLPVTVFSDVKNPLTGKRGAVKVFGAQKGVRPEEADEMDRAVAHFAGVAAAFCGTDHQNTPGAGAAGGLGFALLSFFENARLQPGVKGVLEAVGAEKEIRSADLVVTGEGRFDAQSAEGKVPSGVAKLAAKYGVPTLVLAGSVQADGDLLKKTGVRFARAITPDGMKKEEAMQKEIAFSNLARAAEDFLRSYR